MTAAPAVPESGVLMFFKDWTSLGKIFVMAVVTYAAFILLLRISGKRSFAKLNVHDMIIGVAIGPIFAATITSESLSLFEGMTAIGTLLLLQFVLNRFVRRVPRAEKFFKDDPFLLFYDGRFIEDALRCHGITEHDLKWILRDKVFHSFDEVSAIVLEPDGSFSILRHGWEHCESLGDVMRPPQMTKIKPSQR